MGKYPQVRIHNNSTSKSKARPGYSTSCKAVRPCEEPGPIRLCLAASLHATLLFQGLWPENGGGAGAPNPCRLFSPFAGAGAEVVKSISGEPTSARLKGLQGRGQGPWISQHLLFAPTPWAALPAAWKRARRKWGTRPS